jgi:hypothetical protein
MFIAGQIDFSQLLANLISLLNFYSLFVNARKATRGIECHILTASVILYAYLYMYICKKY